MSHVLQPVSELVSAGVPVRRAGAVSVAEEAAVAAAEAIAAEAAAGVAAEAAAAAAVMVRAATVAAAEAAVRARQTAEVAAAIGAKATAELAVKVDAGADLDVMAEAAAAEAVADAALTSAAMTAAEARRTVAQAIAAEAAAAAVAETAATASATVIAASTAAAAAAVRARHTIEVAAKFAAEAAAAVLAEAATAAEATLDAATAIAEATLDAASATAEATLEAASATAEATLDAASATAEATLDAAATTAATAGHTAAEAGGTTMGNRLDTEPDRRGPDDGAHEAVNAEWAVLLANSSHGQVLLGPFRDGVSLAGPAEHGLWRDISLARRIEAELRAEEGEFEAVFASAPAAMLVVSVVDDQPARFLRVNPALSRLTGYPLLALLDLGLDDLAHPDQPTAGEGSAEPGLRDGAEPYELVRRWVHADGHDLWVRIRMAPTGTADGQEDRWVCQVEDVTGWATGARGRVSRVRAWWGHAGRPGRRGVAEPGRERVAGVGVRGGSDGPGGAGREAVVCR